MSIGQMGGRRHLLRQLLLVLISAVAGTLLSLLGQRQLWAEGNEPVLANTPSALPALCRLGVNATHGGNNPFDAVDLSQLRVSWYIDYQALPAPPRPNGI